MLYFTIIKKKYQEYSDKIAKLREKQSKATSVSESKAIEKQIKEAETAKDKIGSSLDSRQEELSTMMKALSVNGEGVEALSGHSKGFDNLKSMNISSVKSDGNISIIGNHKLNADSLFIMSQTFSYISFSISISVMIEKHQLKMFILTGLYIFISLIFNIPLTPFSLPLHVSFS